MTTEHLHFPPALAELPMLQFGCTSVAGYCICAAFMIC